VRRGKDWGSFLIVRERWHDSTEGRITAIVLRGESKKKVGRVKSQPKGKGVKGDGRESFVINLLFFRLTVREG